MKKFSGVLIATDLDGTLLNSVQELSPKNREAIEYFMSNGGYFTFATGRSPLASEALFGMIPVNVPALMSNGGVLFDIPSKTALEVEYLSPECKKLAYLVHEKFPEVAIEIHLLEKKFVINRGLAVDAHFNFVKCTGEDVKDIATVEAFKSDWLKILVVDDADIVREVGDWLIPAYGADFEIVFSGATLLEIQNKGTGKGEGLMRLADKLGVKREHVYTCGDNQNDLSMLKITECFAPENATPEVKSVATHIMPHHNNDMMAAVIQFLDQKYSRNG